MLKRLTSLLRRADVVSRRKIRHAFAAWDIWTIRVAMVFMRLACSLPACRRQQDLGLYGAALAGVITILVVDWAGRA